MAESEGTHAGGEGNPTLPPPGGRGHPGSARPGLSPGSETVGRRSAAPPAREGQPSADPGWPGAKSHSITVGYTFISKFVTMCVVNHVFKFACTNALYSTH